MTQELRTEDRLRAAAVEFVVITGLSGAGRSEAAKVLEDLGYFVIDNLPPSLIGRVAELAVVGRDPTRVALVMDARGGAFTADVSELEAALDQLRAQDITLRIVFLEASDEVLIRRFEATRRRQLVRHFGSAHKAAQASLAELEQVPGLGPGLAKVVYDHLHGGARQE